MSVSPTGAGGGAYAYLRSLLPPQSADDSSAAGSSDPVQQLLNAFYPSGNQTGASDETAGATATPTGPSCASFSPTTMSSLISVQGQYGQGAVDAQAQKVFGEFDANSDGQIDKSEFEGVFGSNADTAKVDGLFNALDANGDGAISQDELTSAAEQSHAQNHHQHHMHGGGNAGGEGGLASLLSATGLDGANTQTTANPDGSSSTTISYGDGSTVTMTTPATANSEASSQTASDGTSSATNSGSTASNNNLLEQLIRLQAEYLTFSPSQVLATA